MQQSYFRVICKYLIMLIFGLSASFITKQAYADQPSIGEWGTTAAKFEIEKGNINEMKLVLSLAHYL